MTLELQRNKDPGARCLWNTASNKVLVNNGFRFIKHVKEGFYKNGKWTAEDELAINKIEWAQKCNNHNRTMSLLKH